MLAGYYDDSADDETFLVGGLVAHVENWEAFEDEWERKRKEPPAIGYYKAYHARVPPDKRKNDNQFRGFSRGMILKKERTLAQIIVDHAEYAVFSPLNRKLFNSTVLPHVPRRTKGMGRYAGHEYHFPFHGCIDASVDHLIKANIKDEQIDFFFDEQGKVGKWARDMYDVLKERTATDEMRPYLGICLPHNDKKVVALQAADLYASRSRLYDKTNLVDEMVMYMLSAIPCKVKRWPEEQLKRVIAKFYPETDEDN
jgi:hypothetical protein